MTVDGATNVMAAVYSWDEVDKESPFPASWVLSSPNIRFHESFYGTGKCRRHKEKSGILVYRMKVNLI
jgi:hypothetical protein